MEDSQPPAESRDPYLTSFLSFLARDIESSDRVEAIDSALIQRARDLVAGTKVDLNEVLDSGAE